MRTNSDYYSGLAKEPAMVTFIWQRFKGRQESGKALEQKKGNSSAV